MENLGDARHTGFERIKLSASPLAGKTSILERQIGVCRGEDFRPSDVASLPVKKTEEEHPSESGKFLRADIGEKSRRGFDPQIEVFHSSILSA